MNDKDARATTAPPNVRSGCCPWTNRHVETA
eukprot:CAMPEP_0204497418 /NCGR_PEP_ID=MMETSP0471-20130131/90796_1 /ASSEMBLY_ACC=CAM_ASM_000602 /TAXON_ID=2969 /ORGANISM="Oxyrrhis marina" /LENGTH=30 /DNA_ID= /DNA_START= /DNA_END= /DNA_ORIENTATION=